LIELRKLYYFFLYDEQRDDPGIRQKQLLDIITQNGDVVALAVYTPKVDDKIILDEWNKKHKQKASLIQVVLVQ